MLKDYAKWLKLFNTCALSRHAQSMQSIFDKQLKILEGRLFMQHEVIRPEISLALAAQLDNGMCLLLCTKCREHIGARSALPCIISPCYRLSPSPAPIKSLAT